MPSQMICGGMDPLLGFSPGPSGGVQIIKTTGYVESIEVYRNINMLAVRVTIFYWRLFFFQLCALLVELKLQTTVIHCCYNLFPGTMSQVLM